MFKLFKSKPLIKVGGYYYNCDSCGDQLIITDITKDIIYCECKFCGKTYQMTNDFEIGEY